MSFREVLENERLIRYTYKQVLVALGLSPLVGFLGYGVWLLPWGSPAAPGWVQAVGALLSLAVAVAIPSFIRMSELKQQQTTRLEAGLIVAMDMKEIFEELAFYVRMPPVAWKDHDYYESRAKLILSRLSRLESAAGGVSIWSMISRGETALCGLIALLKREGKINQSVVDYAYKNFSGWMTTALDKVGELVKHTGKQQG